MKIVCKKADLSQAIGLTMNAVSNKSTLPVLGNLLFNAVGNQLVLTGTDLEIGLQTKCPVEVIEEGSVTIPAKKILEIVRESPDHDIEITSGERSEVSVTCGKGHFKIMGLSAEDFPNLPKPTEGKKVDLPESVLGEMIKKVGFSVSTDETRYVLNGALFSLKEGSLIMVSTDGHRLSMMEKKIEGGSDEVQAVLPTKALTELSRVLENTDEKVSIQFSNNHLFLEKGSNTLVTRLIDGQFPNYEQVIPKEANQMMTADRETLTKVVKRVALMASDKSKSVKFTLSTDKLVVTAQTPDVGEADEAMDVKYEGEPMTIAFNGTYVVEALKAIEKENVNLMLKSALNPGLLLPAQDHPESRYVIMPMRT